MYTKIKNHSPLFLILLFLVALSETVFSQDLRSQQFRLAEGIIRIAEPGQLSDSVNVWGDVGRTGRYLIPISTNIPQLVSYAGGPQRLQTNVFEGSKVRIRVNINRKSYSAGENYVKTFEFIYKDPLPDEIYDFRLQNDDIVSIEVKRKPNFLDYLKVAGPILSTLSAIIIISERVR